MQKIDNLDCKIDRLSVEVASLPDRILVRADKRYASKTAEIVIYGLVGVILTAFILGVWEFVIK